ncbi:MAG: ABC transporter substrate-binding protein [Caldilineaceae bacterium]
MKPIRVNRSAPARRHTVSRRQFLVGSSLSMLSVAIAACAGAPADAPAADAAADAQSAPAAAEPAVAGQKYTEAPMLAEQVRAGALPPVDERLPVEPVVVEPLDSIGQYGGEWFGGTIETNGNFWIRNGGYQQLLRWTPEWDGIIPNLAESYEANDDATEFTFHLRPGVRYSDGELLTADDIMFWYEDVLMNEELTPSIPTWLRNGDDPVIVEKLDDHTVKFTFSGPQGLFIKTATQTQFDVFAHYPRHYLEQFHPNYNDNIEADAKAAGFDTWLDYFGAKSTIHQNAELPNLRPWLMETGIGESSTGRISATRNPYFHKVDSAGNQLPYMDRYIVDIVADNQVLVLKALNGELDYQERFISDPSNKAVFFDNREQGGFDFYELYPTTVNEFIIQFNMNCTDENLREIFQNKDFRIAMSYAINRQEIIDLVHVGQGQAWQASPRPESRYHHERLATQYTEYNPDLANEHLDKAGYTERDGDGFRLGPDGKRISFIMELDQGRTTYIDAMALIKPAWEAVGVECTVRTMERSLWEERCRGRSLEFHVSGHRFGGGSGDAVVLDARYWLPMNTGNSMFAKAWAFWYNDPNDELAEEPPENIKKAMEIYTSIGLTGDDEEQYNRMMQVLDIAADEFYAIGTVLEPNAFGIVTNRMRNVPKVLPNSWIYPTPGPYNPEQFWVAEA